MRSRVIRLLALAGTAGGIAAAITVIGLGAAHAASGLTPGQLQAIALGHAKMDGEPSPANVRAVTTTHGEAMSLMYPGSPAGAFSDAVPDNTPVYLITMTGRFTAYGAMVPRGASLPTGIQETLVVDTQGQVLDFSLRGPTSAEPDLASAGTVMDLDQ
jgi:hypothetical protein